MLQATGWWRQQDDCLDNPRGGMRKKEELQWRAEAEEELTDPDEADTL